MNVLTSSKGAVPVQDGSRSSGARLSWTPLQFLGLLALLIFAAFPQVATGVRTFFYRDFSAYCYPLNAYTRACLAHGSLPLWNPYSQCGVPHMAQLGTWYPPLLLGILDQTPWFDSCLALLHLAWAGLGMYWLARKFKAGNFASSFAGISFVFNGVILSSLQYNTFLPVLAWMPWVVGCSIQAWEFGGSKIATAAVCAGMQALTGMPELTALTWILIAVIWATSARDRSVSWRQSGLRLAAVALLGFGLTLAQTLPFLDLVAHSQRNAGSAMGERSMPGWGWANLLVPLFHCLQAPQGTWFQNGQDLLPSYYLGVSVLCVASIGVFMARDRFTLVCAGMLLSCWIMALGPNGFVYEWVRRICPIIGFARYPMKFALFTAFLAPVLAFQGLSKLEKIPEIEGRRLLLAIASVAIGLMALLLGFAHRYPFSGDQWNTTFANALWRAAFTLAVLGAISLSIRVESKGVAGVLQFVALGCVAADALTHSPNLTPTVPTSLFAPGIWKATGKPDAPTAGAGRIMLSGAAEQRLFFSEIPNFAADVTAKRMAEWYNFNLLDGIPKVNGAIPLHPRAFDPVEQRLYYTSGVVVGSGMLDFLSVAWVSSPDSAIDWIARTNYLPMLTAGQRPIFCADGKALDAITGESFRPAKEVYLPEEARVAITASSAECKVTAIAFTPQRVEATVEAGAPAIVVHAQNYYHLWRALVDGQEVPLVRANVAFQALQVPAGRHHLKLIYYDYNLVIGAIVSVLSLAACVWIWLSNRPSTARLAH